jgi:hypothetical protein
VLYALGIWQRFGKGIEEPGFGLAVEEVEEVALVLLE